MEFFLGILIGIGFIALAILSRSITTFFHELGHAIPALIFTSEEVYLVVGSYGDLDKSFYVKLGRLTIVFKFNFMVWYQGVCMHMPTRGFAQNFLITIGGPLMSLLLALGLFLWIFQGGQSVGVVVITGIFIISAFIDFCFNIFPNNQAITMYDGTVTFNDGYTLLQLIRSHGQSSAFKEAMEQLRRKNVNGAVVTLESYLQKQPTRYGAEQLVQILFDHNKIDEGINAFEQFIKPLKRKQRDFLLLANLYKEQKNNSAALDCINQYLYKQFNDAHGRNLRGEIYMELNDWDKAFDDFRTVLMMDSASWMAANNLGYILTKRGELTAAKEYMESSLPYLDNSARAQFQAGVYFKDTGQNDLARVCLLKAKEMGFEHHGMEHFLIEVGG